MRLPAIPFFEKERSLSLLLLPLMVCAIAAYAMLLPPYGFKENTFVSITPGESVSMMASALHQQHLISSPLLFKALVRLSQGDAHIHAGPYLFQHPPTLLNVVSRLETGAFGVTSIRITFTEGMTTRDMAARLGTSLPQFDTHTFIREASPLEGYLFPDTYFFVPDATSSSVISLMRANFNARISTIQTNIDAFGHPLASDIVMASLLEREGKTLEDKRMIAGILWNRVRLGMPLQVDAVFGYIEGTATHTPSVAELDNPSPYNTYKYPGLPPGPIDNPGLDSILAAVTPTKTSYLYYLTGKDGQMHYAATFAEHKKNRALYLD